MGQVIDDRRKPLVLEMNEGWMPVFPVHPPP
jgi:hypothetical protein